MKQISSSSSGEEDEETEATFPKGDQPVKVVHRKKNVDSLYEQQ